MPDVSCIVEKTIKLSQPSGKVSLPQPLAYDNAFAHSIRVRVVQDDGTPEYLEDVSAYGSFIRADNKTVTPIMGTVSGDTAEIILPPSCYVSPGRFKCTLNLAQLSDTDGVDAFDPEESYERGDRVTYGGIVFVFTADHEGAWTGEDIALETSVARTALWVEGTVERNITNDLIDPGTPVGNISQILNDASAAATSAASAAAEAIEAAQEANAYSESIAPDYDDVVFPIGAYGQCCWFEGKFYVNTETISTSEVFDPTHWTETDINTELARCVKINGDDIATPEQTIAYMHTT